MTLHDWAAHHCRVFGLAPDQVRTVFSWLPILERAGWTGAELVRATDWLLTHDPPQWFPRDHLAGLRAQVNAGRARERPADVDPLTGEDVAVCVRCGGAGRLVVPDLRQVQGGQWLPRPTARSVAWDTCAVRCSCARGRLRHYGTVAVDGRPHDLMQLDAYEHANPGWQSQLERRRREERALAELDGPPTGRLAEVLARLAGQMRLPGDDGEDEA